jgi:gamma-tubulin complex component 5
MYDSLHTLLLSTYSTISFRSQQSPLTSNRRNVNFAAESSDEGDYEDDRSDLSGPTDTTITSSIDDSIQRRPEDLIVDTTSKEQLQALRQAQFWQKNPSVGGVRLETVKVSITELQAIREVIFMLRGCPTSLFETYPGNPLLIEPSKRFSWIHSSVDSFVKIAKSFAEYGSSVMRLRSWAKRAETIPLIQVLQGALQERLADFDVRLFELETKFVSPSEDTVVSILNFRMQLSPSMIPLLRLSNIIERLVSERYGHAFRYLEMLYDETCISQMAGDSEIYEFMGTMFFQCFQVYLRPIRLWMQEGELSKGDKVFFVAEASGNTELPSIWQSRFKIRKTQEGVLHAPKFLSAAASKIFTTGKSVVILKHLNSFELFRAVTNSVEPILDFQTVCSSSTLALAPFSELFDSAFDTWIRSKHHHASFLLKKKLFDSCGLNTSLDALSNIYFLSDGIVTSAFANTVFDKLDTLNSTWSDGFLLTELAQSTFGVISAVLPDRLRTHILSLSRKQQDVATCRRTVKALSIIEMRYKLSWPIEMIVTPSTIPSYQRVLTFLLQIRRGSHILARERLIEDDLMNSSSSDERALYYSLRAALLWFNQMLYYYLTSIAIEPCTQKMRSELREAEDVDTMISIHASYIKAITDRALLGSKLEPIHKSIVKILDLGIKLMDAQAGHAVASKEAMEQQQEMMDLSMASLGLTTPKRKKKHSHSFRQSFREGRHDIDTSSDEEEDKEVDVDLSLLSTLEEDRGDLLYVDKLWKMKSDFDRLVRFVASGLKGVARAGGGDASRSWDTLGEMLESGLETRSTRY